jgi:hypothetical protein
MKPHLTILTVLFAIIVGCNQSNTNQKILVTAADSLLAHIDQFAGTRVETQGTIVHICGVDRKKMKLKTDGGFVIMIIPGDSRICFNMELIGKRVKIQGLINEIRIAKTQIDIMEREHKVLCHVDHLPCKDTAWVNKNIKAGVADSMSIRSIKKLRLEMNETGGNYISVVSIQAEKWEIIEEKTE